ncbi:hypothetical protein ACFL21_04165 [Patescibacteria group bacterium]
MKIKIFLILSFSLILLPGCFGGGDSTPIEDLDNSYYQTDEFSIKIPMDWEIIESNKFPSNVPSELIVAFQSNIRNAKFTSTVSINKIFFGEEKTVNSDDFYKNSLRKIKNTLVNYEEISIDDIEIIRGEEFIPGVIVIYQGKQRAYDNIVRFRELYLGYGNFGYIVTAAYLTDEDESIVKNIEEMINSFQLQ